MAPRLLVALLLVGCGAAQSPEACLAPKLAPLETAYFAEAMDQCVGYTWEQCPAREELEAKFAAMRAESGQGVRMNPLQFLGVVARLIGKLPPEVLDALLAVVRAVVSSKDPVRAARLAALAAASKVGTEAAIKKALKARAR